MKSDSVKDTLAAGQDSSADAAINKGILTHATGIEPWTYRALYAELVTWADRINQSLFEGKLPPPAISIDHDVQRAYGRYQARRDGLGLKYRININSRFLPRPLGEVLTELMHEMLHLWEEVEKGPQPRHHHSVGLCRHARSLGLEVESGAGHGLRVLEGGLFARLLAQHRVDAPMRALTRPAAKLRKPRIEVGDPWQCSCQKIWAMPGMAVDAECGRCGKTFRLV